MALPEHQLYWFKLAAACGTVGIALIALSGTLAADSETGFDWAGPLMTIAYVAFVAAGACFVSGVRQWKFPLAVGRRSTVTGNDTPQGLTVGRATLPPPTNVSSTPERKHSGPGLALAELRLSRCV